MSSQGLVTGGTLAPRGRSEHFAAPGRFPFRARRPPDPKRSSMLQLCIIENADRSQAAGSAVAFYPAHDWQALSVGPCLFQVLIEYISKHSLYIAIRLVDELLIGLHAPVAASSLSTASRKHQVSTSTAPRSLHRA